MKHFKYIRSDKVDTTGKRIFSGQLVSVHGRINQRELVEVLYEPDFGFRIQGNNFADAYDIKIEKDITRWQKLTGTIRFMMFNLFGYYREEKKGKGIELKNCAECNSKPTIKSFKGTTVILCKNNCMKSKIVVDRTKRGAKLEWNESVNIFLENMKISKLKNNS